MNMAFYYTDINIYIYIYVYTYALFVCISCELMHVSDAPVTCYYMPVLHSLLYVYKHVIFFVVILYFSKAYARV